MGLALVTAPAGEPITVAEAKTHLRVDGTDEDALIGALVGAAREYCEGVQRRAFVTQTWDYKLDGFPAGKIEIPRPPLQSITSIKYIDGDGVEQTVASSDYSVHTSGVVGSVAPAYGKSWPGTRATPDAVTIQFVAGYGAASAVPDKVKQAMKLLIGHWFANREVQVTGTIVSSPLTFAVDALLGLDRVHTF